MTHQDHAGTCTIPVVPGPMDTSRTSKGDISVTQLLIPDNASCHSTDAEYADWLEILPHQSPERLQHIILQLVQKLNEEHSARCAAQEALRLRDTRIGTAIHDLISPMSVVLISLKMLESLQDERRTDERERRLQIGKRNAQRVAEQLRVFLDGLQIARGSIRLNVGPVNLCALLRQAVDDAHSLAQNYQFDLSLPESTVIIQGDAARLRQIIDNLLSNAVKYSPDASHIDIVLQNLGSLVRINIRDQGIGIPAEAVPRLFSNFYRAPNAEQTTVRGFGLGLYVVHELVTCHGGQIRVSSTEGVGSTFTVDLPFQATHATYP